MKLFMSIETQKDADVYLGKILRDTKKSLNFITDKTSGLENVDNYGTEFRSLGIIPTCLDNDFWEASGWKERKQIWRKKREADIRIRMDYERFIKETPENKRLMFIDILIKSVQVVQDKSKGDFRGKELIDDILNTLDVTKDQLAILNL